MIKIGILGCAEIAFRRFLPALMENKEFECVCIAEEYDKSKLEQFEKEFGIKSAENFQAIIEDENIDAVYIPLPPSLICFCLMVRLTFFARFADTMMKSRRTSTSSSSGIITVFLDSYILFHLLEGAV